MDSISRKRRRSTRPKNRGRKVIDRLSSLPEDILVKILSLCDYTSVVRSAVLSRRWQYLWTQITSLNMINFKFKNNFDFLDIFDNVLINVTSPVIHNVELGFYATRPLLNIRSTVTDKFFHQICSRKVEIIKVKAVNYSTGELPRVPSCIFQVTSLIELEFGDGFCVDLPNQNDIVALPRLKKLTLNGLRTSSHGELLGKLVKSCPSLECLDFSMFGVHNNVVIEICGHKLKRLGMTCDFNGKIVINVPNLEYLHIHNVIGLPDVCSKTVLNSLLEAQIFHIGPMFFLLGAMFHPIDAGRCPLLPFYGAISSAKSLVLLITDVIVSELVFPNLTYLKVCPFYRINLQNLMRLLNCSPGLEVFDLNLTNDEFDNDDESWVSQNSSVPECLVNNVKRMFVSINASNLDKTHPFCKLVKYLLRSSRVLELLEISIPDTTVTKQADPSEEIVFCKEIYGFERCSSSCQIEFSGQHLKVPKEGKRVRCPTDRRLMFLK